MHTTPLIALCIAIAAMLSAPAFAQGEVGNVPKAEPRVKRTPEQRAAGKAQRRTEGREGARAGAIGEVGPVVKAGPTTCYTKDEKKTARATRKAVAARANKAGEIPAPGEVGPRP